MNKHISLSLLLLVCTVSQTDVVQGQEADQRRSEHSQGFWYKGTFVGHMPARESLLSKKSAVRKNRFIQQVTGQFDETEQFEEDVEVVSFDSPVELDLPADLDSPTELDVEFSEDPYTTDFHDHDEPIHYQPAAQRGPCVAPACRPFIGSGCDRFHVKAEYLVFWTKGLDVPALATTSSQATAGRLGQDDTNILFGSDKLNDDARSGGRFELGYWLDDCHQHAIEATYLTLEEESETFSASDADYTVLARPFFNVTTDQQDARRIVFPGESEGSLSVDADTRFQAVEVLLRRAMHRSCDGRIDLLLGYRFAELEDRLRIDDFTRVLNGVNAGTTFDLYDRFETSNTFHGFEIGMAGEWHPDSCWTVDMVAKLAMGSNASEVSIAGETVQTPNVGAAVTSQGGLLAVPTNIGTYSDDHFGTVTELGITLRRRVYHRVELSLGYSFILWTEVARAGDQIDPTLNQTQLAPGGLVGEARPEFTSRVSDFWAQGLRFGVQSRF